LAFLSSPEGAPGPPEYEPGGETKKEKKERKETVKEKKEKKQQIYVVR